ncbi:potassium channel family protein [Dichotomicrobium thermohalophilum]|uniref:Ion channel n=1 Tax=Dichotomicrobium thermohalophilum TaxID=933063 RepID=A0A397Q251_9HYPH|nr:potassium channel family protein [Dichotomicrobium thermohalophilum]RIA55013.1 ion channel [Dichotomicrobium thermohalophilum]
MFSFLLTFVRLVKAVALLWHNPEFRNIAILILILVGLGTVFYAVVEGWHWFDALYFTVITLATVGYGDFAPQTVFGKAFTIVYVIIGLGLFVTLVRYVAEGILKDRAEHQRARQSDKKPER